MEFRWFRYTMEEWAHQGAFKHMPGIESDGHVYVLQYREGATHDAPWMDIPVVWAFKPVPIPSHR